LYDFGACGVVVVKVVFGVVFDDYFVVWVDGDCYGLLDFVDEWMFFVDFVVEDVDVYVLFC